MEKHAVTGAFGYSGKYIARRLLAKGHEVITLTNSQDRENEFGGRVTAHPFNFDKPELLTKTLEGVKVLYNTYWVRFNHAMFKHQSAVENTLTMFDCAKAAGVERIVHVSILNADENSHLEYYSGKGRLERALKETGISYAILRPTVLFGDEDILINNITYMLRKFPVFGIFGDGKYRMQPIFVDDLAKIAVEQGESRENVTIDAVCPESFTFEDLVRTIGEIVGKKARIVHIPPWLGGVIGKVMGWFLGDVLITPEEIDGLMQDLLYNGAPPAADTRLTDWLREHKDRVGVKYHSELARRKDRKSAY
ncbi:MAG: NAD(P)H-binding protein [Planctomycetes bacterium]|nr:NAD(P)H-binding protein [Planctomycetota bacterium]